MLAVLALAAFAMWRSANRNLYLFCAAWTILTFAPAMRLTALATMVEDRLLYAPAFGVSLAMALAVCGIAASFPRARIALGGAVAVLMLAYAISILRIEPYWHDDPTFFARCEQLDPHDIDYPRIRVNLMKSGGDYDGAVGVVRQAIRDNPDNPYLHTRMAELYGMMGRPEDASSELTRARTMLSGTNR